MKNLQAKIDATNKKLGLVNVALWKVTEEKRILEKEMMELREKMFNINKKMRVDMKIGEEIEWCWSGGQGSVIKRTSKGYELYESPLLDDKRYFKTYPTLQEAKDQADKWT